MLAAPDRTADALADTLREELEARIDGGRLELPMLPHVASEILATGLDDTVEMRDLSKRLQRDQALAGHVLRVANSAAYAGGTRIQSLQQALVRIGLAQLREIVVAVALQSRVFRVDGFDDFLRRLWSHSAVAGMYAKEIARGLRANVESAFLCGLLHDVGKPVVLAALLDCAETHGIPIEHSTCAAAVGPYHTRVGRVLAEQWSLPDPVTAAIAHHHDVEGASAHPQAAAIACLANLVAHAIETDDEAQLDAAAETLRQHRACAILNLYPEDVDALVARRAQMLEYARALSA